MPTERFEAVTTCVGYADLLREVAPHNRALLDRWIIVTTPEDDATKAVCRAHSIECLTTRDFDREKPFSKAHGINRGLQLLRGDGWLMHLDADICLPFDFHQCLESAQLRKGTINGALRLNVVGYQQWDRVKAQGLYARENGWLVEFQNRNGCGVGGIPAGRESAYAPIGYFQLWSGDESLTWKFPRKFYPELHGGAARTDVAFALQWDRRDRLLIPELVVFHLESEPSHMGKNWGGRKSKPFRSLVGSVMPGAKAETVDMGDEGGYCP
jgi:hypothetical protein